mgnify:CR=1 FL=1
MRRMMRTPGDLPCMMPSFLLMYQAVVIKNCLNGNKYKETAIIPFTLRQNKKEASAVMSWISLLLSTNALMVLSQLNGNPYQAYVTLRKMKHRN